MFLNHIETKVGPLDLVVFNPGGNVYFPVKRNTLVFRKVWEMSCYGGFNRTRSGKIYGTKRGGQFFLPVPQHQ